MRQTPVDAVGRGEYDRILQFIGDAHRVAEPLVLRRGRVVEDHSLRSALVDAAGPQPDDDVVVAAALELGQAQIGLFPMDAVLRAGVAQAGVAGVPQVVGFADLHDGAVDVDVLALPRAISHQRVLPRLAGRMHGQFDILSIRP